jgi:phage gp46-like protein
MTDAVVSQGGIIALTSHNPSADIGHAGVIAITIGASTAEISQSGLMALTAHKPAAQIGHAGLMALVRYKDAYVVAQAGMMGLTINESAAHIEQAGLLTLTVNNPAAHVGQLGVMALVRYLPPAAAPTKTAPPRLPGTPVDIQLAYDPVKKRCDVVFNGTDFALDTTQVSAVLMSIFTDRRANPDDALPDAVSDFADPQSFIKKRGWCGDALDKQGRLIGSRSWLNSRAKETEQTRKDEEAYLAEGLDWIETQRGAALQLTVRLPGGGILAFRVRVGKSTILIDRTIN